MLLVDRRRPRAQVTSARRPERAGAVRDARGDAVRARVRSRGASDDAARAHGRGETFELPGSSLSRSGLVGTASAAKGGSSTLGEATAKLRSATAASLARRSGAKIDPGGGRFYGTDDANANGGGASSSKKTASPSSASTGAASTPSSGRATSEFPRPLKPCTIICARSETAPARMRRRARPRRGAGTSGATSPATLKTLLGQMRYFKQHLAADVETRPEASAELERPSRHTHVRVARGSRGRSGPARHDDELRGADDIERFSAHGRVDGKMRRLCRGARARNLRSRADLANLARGLLEKIARRMSDDALESLLATSDEDVVHVAPSGGRPEVREKNDSDSETRARGDALPRQDRGADRVTPRGRRGDDRPMRRVRLAVQRETPLRPAMPEGAAARGLSRRRHRATRADERL